MKQRLIYMCLTCCIMAAGLSTRKFADSLPQFIAAHFGDALWAAMIYSGIRSIGARKPLEKALLYSLAFCTAIELSQLYQAEWISQIRHTVLGGLILGKGFLLADLARYAAGIFVVYLLDRLANRMIQKRKLPDSKTMK